MRTSTYTAWDRALDGRLAELLRAYRAEGLSYDEIVYRLRQDHDVAVSRSTAFRWVEIAQTESGGRWDSEGSLQEEA